MGETAGVAANRFLPEIAAEKFRHRLHEKERFRRVDIVAAFTGRAVVKEPARVAFEKIPHALHRLVEDRAGGQEAQPLAGKFGPGQHGPEIIRIAAQFPGALVDVRGIQRPGQLGVLGILQRAQ